MMPQICPFRILLITAVLVFFAIAAHAETAKPTRILDAVLTRMDVPGDTQERVRSVLGEFISEPPTAHLVLIGTRHDLIQVQEQLATALAVTDMPVLGHQMIPVRLDTMRAILTLREKRMSLIHDQMWPEVLMDEGYEYAACSAPRSLP